MRIKRMGSKTHFGKVTNEFAGEEHGSGSEDEDKMTIHQYLAAKGKRVLPFPNSDSKDQVHMHEVEQTVFWGSFRRFWTRSRTKRRYSLGIIDSALYKAPWRTERKRKLQRLEVADRVSRVPLSVTDRAEEVRANLDPQFPSFVKIMLPSHVVRGFWLSLPGDFCKTYLPERDAVCTLEDEDGEEYRTKFLAGKIGLSGGWRGFAVAHKLLVGDAVVFQLLRTCKFKVFIVRATSLGEVDGALGLVQLGRSSHGIESGPVKVGGKVCAEKHMTRMNIRFDPDKAEGCGRSLFLDFKNFNIIVNDHILDSLIPLNIRLKYFKLCRAQKSYLHSGLHKTISVTLAAGIISETIAIADAIKSSSISTRKSEFALWDKTLAGFQCLGFEVGFLRARIGKLAVFAPFKSYKQAKLEQYLCRGRNRNS